jgi:type 1 glutamine amidotransferase
MTRNLLLSGGPLHDFGATADLLTEIFAEVGLATTTVEHPDDGFAQLRAAEAGAVDPFDVVTVNALHCRLHQPRHASLRDEWAYDMDARDAALLRSFVQRGGGLLALHTAVICFDADPTWRELCGAVWDWSTSSHPAVGPVAVTVTAAGRDDDITAGIDDFTIDDEAYGFLDEVDGIVPLLTARHGGRDHPILWTRRVGSGEVVTDLLGHGVASLRHPAHRTILERAALRVLGCRRVVSRDELGNAS